MSGAPSAAGVGDSAASLNLPMRFLLATTMIGEDGGAETRYLHSGLDWSAPRPTRLTDGPPTGRIAVVDAFSAAAAISRADVAAWMLDALDLPAWPAPGWGTRAPQITGG